MLDDPVRSSLDGRHRGFAIRSGRAARYAPDVSPFGTLPSDANADDWNDLARIAGGEVALLDIRGVGPGWEVARHFDTLQMVLSEGLPKPSAPVERLTVADVDAMMELVELTHPGPFARRTIELGSYLGIRDGDRLVAMAGERMSPAGWTEISAVCTAPDHRGLGLARTLIGAVAHGIQERGDRVFLHVIAENSSAIALYESIGFAIRRQLTITAVRSS